jgi:hypothetical protein
LSGVLKAIEKAKSLDKPQGQYGEQPCVRNDGNQPAKAKAGPLEEGKALRVSNQFFRNGIQARQRYQVHVPEVRHYKPMLHLELPPEIFPVDFDRAESGYEPEPRKPPESSSCHRIM